MTSSRITCPICRGAKGGMVETPFEARSYSSTSSGEFNGPCWKTCNYCKGTGKVKKQSRKGKT